MLTRREWLTAAGGATAALWLPPSWAAAQADRAKEWPPKGAGALDVPPRTPRFPLKTARTLRTDAEIMQARANIAQYPAARERANVFIRAADRWLSWNDADLARLATPASVPRAFDVGATIGCPKCGQTIHEKFGSYPWIADPKVPFKLRCPVDGTVYPDNDYAAYLASGFRDKKGWDKPVVDDGWGWLNPANGERYWFVAHWNHAMWHRNTVPAVAALGLAYQFTGDKRYAHKAAVLLYHMAQVYPAMDHEKQSRYGLLQAAKGARYPGKVLNHIWETNLVTQLTQGYDAVWETLDGDTTLQQMTGKSGRDIRAFIEANLLEDAVDAYYSGRIVGNYGMHQSTMGHLAVVRQHGDTAKWIGGLLDGKGAPTSAPSYLGIYYALYDSVFRDGIPSESAVGYNSLWVGKLTELALLLRRGGQDLFKTEPRLRRLYDAALALENADGYLPSWGDSGVVWGDKASGRSPDVYRPAAQIYKDDRYARYVAPAKAETTPTFPNDDALFLIPAKPVSRANAPAPVSRLLDGAGIAVLRDKADKTSVTLTYGWKAGHGHFDRMNFELFAAGVPIMPDLGYPDAMNEYVSGIYTWSKNTVSHNTVVVDASRQASPFGGTVRLFAPGAGVRVLDVDASGTYPQATEYRRALTMVDVGNGTSYLLDVFRVAGGKQHDYVLHGPPGSYAPQGSAPWSDPQTGTLAGPNVPLGKIYDNATMGAADYKGGYASYTGSGFQHLTKVRRKGESGGDCLVEWQHAKTPSAKLRIRVLPQTGQEMILAEARVSPIKEPATIGYLIARRSMGTDASLQSRFVSVIEPFADTPFIESVTPVSLQAGQGIAVLVRRVGGETDLIVSDRDGAEKRLSDAAGNAIVTDAHTAVLTRDASGHLRRVFLAGAASGCRLTVGGKEYKATGFTATVAAVDLADRKVTVTPGAGQKLPAVGSVVSLVNANGRPSACTVAASDKNTLTFAEDLLIGRAPVRAVADKTVTVGNALPLAGTYAGAALYADADRTRPCVTIVSAAPNGTLTLKDAPPTGSLPTDSDLWLACVAPGDRVELPSILTVNL